VEEHIFDACGKSVAFIDQHRHHLGHTDGRSAGLGKVKVAAQRASGQRLHVDDPSHRHDGIRSQVRMDEQGLRFGIADHPDPAVPFELGQFRLEFGPEIVVFEIVDGPGKDGSVIYGHTTPAGAEM